MSRTKVNHIEVKLNEEEYIPFKQSMINNEVNNFLKNYTGSNSAPLEETINTFLVFTIVTDDEKSVDYILSRNFIDHKVLNITNAAGQTAIASSLGAATSEANLQHIRAFIDRNKSFYTNGPIDAATVEILSYGTSGGEYFTQEEAIKNYLQPLYYDDHTPNF